MVFFPPFKSFKWFPSLSIFLTVLTVRVCSSAGTWSGLTPSCRPISCGPPPSLHSHSAIQLLNRTTSWMAVAEYNCLPGYRDSGGQVFSSMCVPHGTRGVWSVYVSFLKSLLNTTTTYENISLVFWWFAMQHYISISIYCYLYLYFCILNSAPLLFETQNK